MLFRARRALRRAWFNFNCRALLRTAPIDSTDRDLTVVTMLCRGEVLMYLLAVKSFCRQLGRVPAVVVLDDGSLGKDDYATLRAHIPQVRIVRFAEVEGARCPKGNCWERLLLVSDLARESYVVQLDSDTLTMSSIEEVQRCIAANRSFTLLGDRSYPKIESMANACERSKGNQHTMVQAVCERSFDQLAEADTLNYVRGNAGFTGFARGTASRAQIEHYSDLMRGLAKDKWDEWGSEQVASNILIANAPDPYPLDFPKYLSYWAHPDVPYERAAFVHFIGPYRFANGFYLRSARKMIAALRG